MTDDVDKGFTLRKELRLAEAQLDLANSGSLALLGIALAALAIYVPLLHQESAVSYSWVLVLILGGLAAVAAIGAGVLIFRRGVYVERIVKAEDALAQHRAGEGPAASVVSRGSGRGGGDGRSLAVVSVALLIGLLLAYGTRP